MPLLYSRYKKARREGRAKLLIPEASGGLQSLFLLLAANFTFFKYRDNGHQADTANGRRVQRCEGARPAGEAEDRRAVGDHPEAQLGEAVANQVGEGAFDAVSRANRFFGTKPTAATPISSCGPKTKKPRANSDIR